MQLTALEITGFKSFGKKTVIKLDHSITAIVGPNGSGKSNVAEAIRFVLGEQSIKSMRGKQGTDLIFKGSNSLSPLARASVTAFFDNKTNKNIHLTDGVFSHLQFDEIRITREIYSDGTNEYYINDSKIRLKDVQELLSTANIGSTGHHIISQGEADRILSANSKERREILEDALGLKLYQFRIKEAERKLERTDQNLKEGEIAQREIAPHLNYLKKQVEKIESRKTQTEELAHLYSIYLKREEDYITEETRKITEQGNSSTFVDEKNSITLNIERIENTIKKGFETKEIDCEINSLAEKFYIKKQEVESISSKIIRLEAEQKVLQKNIEKAIVFDEKIKEQKSSVSIQRSKAELSRKAVEDGLTQIKWRLEKNEIHEAPRLITVLGNSVKEFFDELMSSNTQEDYIGYDTDELTKELGILKSSENELRIEYEIKKSELSIIENELSELRSKRDSLKDVYHNEEMALYEEKNKLLIIEKKIIEAKNNEEKLEIRKTRLVEEISEGSAIIGSDILLYKKVNEDILENRNQYELYRAIERLKIKLEESGVSNTADVLKEFSETNERNDFLKREIEDLVKTKTELKNIISDLNQKLKEEFDVGVNNINKEFNLFFNDMFSGGSAKLIQVEKEKKSKKSEDESFNIDEETIGEIEIGIDVEVNLPGKKVKDLSMLSGGERALSSIALLFAISGVNPPPFMVLDETDAALDEANARRYGKSLKSLSKHSKLVVITHNRETMNGADALFGVTVGKDGASKLLSVAFEEAAEYAK